MCQAEERQLVYGKVLGTMCHRDMLIKDKFAGNMLASAAMHHFLRSDLEEQMHVVIDLFSPMMLNFRAGWYSEELVKKLNPTYLTFEEMIEDDVNMMIRACKEIGVEISAEKVECIRYQIQVAGGINLNKGKSGRGREVLNSSHMDRLRILAKRVGCLDEEFLGISMLHTPG
jgi:hypothetical protein